MNIDKQLAILFGKDRMAIRAILCEVEADFDVVDELMQDTFLLAWERRGQYQAKAKLLTWVCQIAKNVARDHVKAKRGAPDLVPEDTLRVADSDGYTDTLVAAHPEDDPAAAYQAQDTLDSACIRMPKQMAQCVRLRLHGHDNSEIAAELGTSDAVVRSQISQARRYFD